MGPPDTWFFDDTIADRFDAVMNPSDIERRIAIVFDALLGFRDANRAIAARLRTR